MHGGDVVGHVVRDGGADKVKGEALLCERQRRLQHTGVCMGPLTANATGPPRVAGEVKQRDRAA